MPCKLVGEALKEALWDFTLFFKYLPLTLNRVDKCKWVSAQRPFHEWCSRYFPLNFCPSLLCLECICDNCHVKHLLKHLLKVDFCDRFAEQMRLKWSHCHYFKSTMALMDTFSPCRISVASVSAFWDLKLCFVFWRWPPHYIFCELSSGVALEKTNSHNNTHFHVTLHQTSSHS